MALLSNPYGGAADRFVVQTPRWVGPGAKYGRADRYEEGDFTEGEDLWSDDPRVQAVLKEQGGSGGGSSGSVGGGGGFSGDADLEAYIRQINAILGNELLWSGNKFKKAVMKGGFKYVPNSVDPSKMGGFSVDPLQPYGTWQETLRNQYDTLQGYKSGSRGSGFMGRSGFGSSGEGDYRRYGMASERNAFGRGQIDEYDDWVERDIRLKDKAALDIMQAKHDWLTGKIGKGDFPPSAPASQSNTTTNSGSKVATTTNRVPQTIWGTANNPTGFAQPWGGNPKTTAAASIWGGSGNPSGFSKSFVTNNGVYYKTPKR